MCTHLAPRPIAVGQDQHARDDIGLPSELFASDAAPDELGIDAGGGGGGDALAMGVVAAGREAFARLAAAGGEVCREILGEAVGEVAEVGHGNIVPRTIVSLKRKSIACQKVIRCNKVRFSDARINFQG